MGQYYLICNIDKEEYINPHKFGEGWKLMEFANSRYGTLCGLAVLLADGNNRGGGDLHSDHEIIGSWAGDRVVVAGDYADEGKFLPDGPELKAKEFKDGSVNLFAYAGEKYTDVSDEVIDAIADGEGGRHPLAKMDRSEDGWRDKPEWG